MKFFKKRLERKTYLTFFSLLAFVIMFSSCANNTNSADIIVFNANVWTGDEDQKTAQAFAVKGDKILDVGTDEAMQ